MPFENSLRVSDGADRTSTADYGEMPPQDRWLVGVGSDHASTAHHGEMPPLKIGGYLASALTTPPQHTTNAFQNSDGADRREEYQGKPFQ